MTEDQPSKDNAKILVVDDCPFNTVALQRLLSQFNFESDHCSNGNDAVKKVMDRRIDGLQDYKLIFMDYSMPRCDGPKAAAMIKEFYINQAAQSQLTQKVT